MAEETGLLSDLRRAASSIKRMEDISSEMEIPHEAAEYFLKGLSILELIVEKTDDTSNRWDLGVGYIKAGDRERNNSKLYRAKIFYLKAADLFERLAVSSENPAFRRTLAICLGRLGGLAKVNGDKQQAEEHYRKAL